MGVTSILPRVQRSKKPRTNDNGHQSHGREKSALCMIVAKLRRSLNSQSSFMEELKIRVEEATEQGFRQQWGVADARTADKIVPYQR